MNDFHFGEYYQRHMLSHAKTKLFLLDTNPVTQAKMRPSLRAKVLKFYEMLTLVCQRDPATFFSPHYGRLIEAKIGDVRSPWEELVAWGQEWLESDTFNRMTAFRYVQILEHLGLIQVEHEKLREQGIASSKVLRAIGHNTSIKVIRLNLDPVHELIAADHLAGYLECVEAQQAVDHLLDEVDIEVEAPQMVLEESIETGCVTKSENLLHTNIYNTNTREESKAKSSLGCSASQKLFAGEQTSTALPRITLPVPTPEDEDWLVEASRSVGIERIRMLRSAIPENPNSQFYATWIGEINGRFWTPWVLWDIDGGDSGGVERSLEITRGFVEHLLKQGAVEEALRVVFSTSKGFHVYLDSRSIDLQPSPTLHDELKRFCMSLLPQADPSLYSRRRIVGVPNSIHRSTKLLYVSIPLEHLDAWDIPDMRAYAQHPREFDARVDHLQPVPPLVNLYQSILRKAAPPPDSGFMIRPMREIIGKTDRGLEYFFTGAKQGYRDSAMYELAAWCRRKQLPIAMTFVLVSYANGRNDPPMTESEIKQKINSAYASTGERV